MAAVVTSYTQKHKHQVGVHFSAGKWRPDAHIPDKLFATPKDTRLKGYEEYMREKEMDEMDADHRRQYEEEAAMIERDKERDLATLILPKVPAEHYSSRPEEWPNEEFFDQYGKVDMA